MPELRNRATPTLAVIFFTALLSFSLAGCSDDASSCVEELGPTCQPLYEPVYTEVFARTIKPRCALEGGSCHSREGAKGDLIMEDFDATYDALVSDGLVLAGDTKCSVLLARVGSTGEGLMPPGSPLSDAERCSLETWVRNGASK